MNKQIVVITTLIAVSAAPMCAQNVSPQSSPQAVVQTIKAAVKVNNWFQDPAAAEHTPEAKKDIITSQKAASILGLTLTGAAVVGYTGKAAGAYADKRLRTFFVGRHRILAPLSVLGALWCAGIYRSRSAMLAQVERADRRPTPARRPVEDQKSPEVDDNMPVEFKTTDPKEDDARFADIVQRYEQLNETIKKDFAAIWKFLNALYGNNTYHNKKEPLPNKKQAVKAVAESMRRKYQNNEIVTMVLYLVDQRLLLFKKELTLNEIPNKKLQDRLIEHLRNLNR